jgi:hypothetical protein
MRCKSFRRERAVVASKRMFFRLAQKDFGLEILAGFVRSQESV